MRLRTLRWWKKYKLVWLALLGWTVMGAAAVFLLGYNVLDLRGGLPKVEALYEEKVTLQDVAEIVVEAEGIRLEMAESYHVRDLTIQLYGEDYGGQSVAYQEQDGKLHVYYQPYPITANAYGYHQTPKIVLRLLFPSEQYRQITVKGNWLAGEFRQIETELLDLQIAHGSILLEESSLDRLQIETTDSTVNLQDNKIIQFKLDNLAGESILYGNEIDYWLYDTLWGNLDVWSKNIKGNWQLHGRWGDIMVATKKQPNNLLLDVWSKKGVVEVGYNKDAWEDIMTNSWQDGHLQAKIGQGHNILMIENNEGKINLSRDKKRFVYEQQ